MVVKHKHTAEDFRTYDFEDEVNVPYNIAKPCYELDYDVLQT